MADTKKGFNFPKPTYGEWRIVFSWPAFPDTAVIGDTFAACFAGAFAAISTVISPHKRYRKQCPKNTNAKREEYQKILL